MTMMRIAKTMKTTAVSTLSAGLALFALMLAVAGQAYAAPTDVCNRILTADIVAFDTPLMWNRLGAQNINAQMFALKRDVINLDSGKPLTAGGAAIAGKVALRPDKRPRPLVLRMGTGDCLKYRVTNLLNPTANPFNANEERSGIDFALDRKSTRLSSHMSESRMPSSA